MRNALLAAALSTTSVLAPPAASAEDFKVVTKIYVGNTHRSTSTTIFYRGTVYDISQPAEAKGEPQEYTLFRAGRGEITLVNRQQNTKATVDKRWLAQFTAYLKTTVKPQSQALVDPRFQETFKGGVLRLASPQLTYEVETLPSEFKKAAAEYFEFADWFAQLNATDTRNFPPFARLKLNEALVRRKVVPKNIVLRIRHRNTDTRVRATHEYLWAVGRQDALLCQRIGDHLATARKISFKEYRDAQLAKAGEGRQRR